MSQPLANALHRALHIAFGAVNQRNTQIPHSGRQFLLEDGQGFVRGTRHQHMLPLGQKMPQQIGNGMGLARARRPLHHHSRRGGNLSCNAQLLGISRFRQQNILRLAADIGQIHRKWFRLFLRAVRVHNAQKRLRHIPGLLNPRHNRRNRTLRPRLYAAQKEHLPRIGQIPVRRQHIKAIVRKPAVRRKRRRGLCQKRRYLIPPRMQICLIHGFSKGTNPLRLHPRHILKHIHIKFRGIFGGQKLHLAFVVVMQAHPLQNNRMIDGRIQTAQKKAIACHQFQPFRVLAQFVVKLIQLHKELLRAALDHFPGPPERALPLPLFQCRQAHPGIHKPLRHIAQTVIMAQTFLPHLDIRHRKIPPVRRTNPANEVKGQLRTGNKLRLFHLQQHIFPGTFRLHPNPLGVHWQLIQIERPLLILNAAHQLLPQGNHLADIIQ